LANWLASSALSSASRPVAGWIRRLALAGVVLGFCVVVLGAYVRLNAAGLGCPDWPGCYGHVTPIGAQQSVASQAAFPGRPLEVAKAWREMIHRYAASVLVLIIVCIAALAFASRERAPPQSPIVARVYAAALLGIVLLQALLGMWTVTLLLKPLIVTLHLLFGLTTLGLLWWLYLSVPRGSWGNPGNSRVAISVGGDSAERLSRILAIAALCLLVAQIALGGWTSSNYAAVACPDFPKCQNAWLPEADFRNAFILWRGLGIDYEGGVLANPARVAIHLVHRFGVATAGMGLLVAALVCLRKSRRHVARIAAACVLAALVLQLTIGVTMVLRGFPLWLATAHNGGAALLLLATLALVWSLSGRSSVLVPSLHT
jgi:heme a synthase